MKKVDFDRRLVDLEGKALPFAGKEIGHLKDIVAHALLSADGQKNAEEMHARYKLARRIKNGGEVALDDIDLQRIQWCAGASLTTIALGIVFEMLGVE
jgi:hypothetical protein